MLASEVLEFILLASRTVDLNVWGAVVRGAGIWGNGIEGAGILDPACWGLGVPEPRLLRFGVLGYGILVSNMLVLRVLGFTARVWSTGVQGALLLEERAIHLCWHETTVNQAKPCLRQLLKPLK